MDRPTGIRWVLAVAVMLAGPPLLALLFGTIAPALPSIARAFGSEGAPSGLVAQFVMTLPAAGLIVGGAAGGWLLDRLGARRLLTGALLLYAVSGSAGLWAPSAELLLASRFLLGMAGAALGTAAAWLIGRYFDDAGRARLLGYSDALSGAASMSGILISGLVVAAAGWRAPFALYLIALPFLAAVWAAVPAAAAASAVRERGDWTPVVSLWPLYLLIAPLAILMLMPGAQFGFVLQQDGFTDPVVQSRVIAMGSLTAILASAAYGPLRARLGGAGMLAVMLACFAAGAAAAGIARGPLLLGLASGLLGLGSGTLNPHFAAEILRRARAESRGRALGLMYSAIFIGDLLNPVVMYPLRQAFGVHGAFFALAVPLALGVLLVLTAGRFRRPAGSRPA